RQYIFYLLPFRQTFNLHPLRRLPTGNLLLLVGAKFQRPHRHTVVFLKDSPHPERHRIEMSAHANRFTRKVLGFLNTTRAAHKDIAVAELSVWKHRNGAERRAAGDPAEKHAHLQFADVEFEILGEASV